jgi:hypothetical protein
LILFVWDRLVVGAILVIVALLRVRFGPGRYIFP